MVAADAGPIESTLAHRARRGGRVDITIGEVAPVEPTARITNRKKLGVGGGIALQHNVVPTFAHDDAIAHDNGAVGMWWLPYLTMSQRQPELAAGTGTVVISNAVQTRVAP